MKNGRCRMHGGKSSGAPKGNRNALKHVFFTRQMMEGSRKVRMLIKQVKEIAENIS
jgi:hypothetical protein